MSDETVIPNPPAHDQFAVTHKDGCTFEYRGKTQFVEFDNRIVEAIRARKLGGPRNPQKMRLLGLIGECLVPALLKEAGFTEIRNLNSERMNHPDADITAARKGEKFFISVKARNKFQNDDTLNSRYKLESKGRKVPDAVQAANERGEQFAWVTVQIDNDTYCAYFGTHASLCGLPRCNGKGVPMNADRTKLYEPLAVNERHDLPLALFGNRREGFRIIE